MWTIISVPDLAMSITDRHSPILPMIKEWHKSPKGPPWRTGEVVVQNINPNVSPEDFSCGNSEHDPDRIRQPPEPPLIYNLEIYLHPIVR